MVIITLLASVPNVMVLGKLDQKNKSHVDTDQSNNNNNLIFSEGREHCRFQKSFTMKLILNNPSLILSTLTLISSPASVLGSSVRLASPSLCMLQLSLYQTCG